MPDLQHSKSESEVAQPSLTPLLGDATSYAVYPRATDTPPKNLDTADHVPDFFLLSPADLFDMKSFSLPRHGDRPSPVPTDWPADKPLPGAINLSFLDGHGKLVKLDRLWRLYWYKDYQPPAKRPGLP
jgi:hypothetical protein